MEISELAQRGCASVEFLADSYLTFGMLRKGEGQEVADAGVDTREAVDKYLPDDALVGKLAQRRQAMIGEILRTFGTEIPEGVIQSSKFGS